MRKYKDSFVKILLPFFFIGLLIGAFAWNLKQGAYIDQLEQELDETREQLYIKDDMLKQVYMYREREFYMNQIEDDADE